jgi:hypothetical protein
VKGSGAGARSKQQATGDDQEFYVFDLHGWYSI